MTPEFCNLTTYCRGSIVWFGEIKYIAKDFVTSENPDESDKFEVYFRYT